MTTKIGDFIAVFKDELAKLGEDSPFKQICTEYQALFTRYPTEEVARLGKVRLEALQQALITDMSFPASIGGKLYLTISMALSNPLAKEQPLAIDSTSPRVSQKEEKACALTIEQKRKECADLLALWMQDLVKKYPQYFLPGVKVLGTDKEGSDSDTKNPCIRILTEGTLYKWEYGFDIGPYNGLGPAITMGPAMAFYKRSGINDEIPELFDLFNEKNYFFNYKGTYKLEIGKTGYYRHGLAVRNDEGLEILWEGLRKLQLDHGRTQKTTESAIVRDELATSAASLQAHLARGGAVASIAPVAQQESPSASILVAASATDESKKPSLTIEQKRKDCANLLVWWLKEVVKRNPKEFIPGVIVYDPDKRKVTMDGKFIRVDTEGTVEQGNSLYIKPEKNIGPAMIFYGSKNIPGLDDVFKEEDYFLKMIGGGSAARYCAKVDGAFKTFLFRGIAVKNDEGLEVLFERLTKLKLEHDARPKASVVLTY